MTEHSPVPWKVMEVFARGGSMGYYIVDSDGNNVTYHEPGEGNFHVLIKSIEVARFIVTACNCHADLLEALKEIAKGEGAYSRDPLTHAGNTITSMKNIATEAIRLTQETP